MTKAIGLLLLILASQPALAKADWPLTIKVLNTKNIENEHGSFRIAWGGGAGGGGWSHRVAEHAFIEASDGNSYELVPSNPKDMLLPGTFQARIEKRDIGVCEPKDNGTCREVKFKIVAAIPTAKTLEPTPSPVAAAIEAAPKPPDVPIPAAQASVLVESTPPGADIEIDGGFVGNTPSTLVVAPGKHQVVVRRKGFADWEKTINVTGGTVRLDAELEQEPDKQ